ncbi:MAG: sulfocyanin-like copper-binding protein [Bacilli bacterium]
MPYYLLKYLNPLTIEQFYALLLRTAGILAAAVIVLTYAVPVVKRAVRQWWQEEPMEPDAVGQDLRGGWDADKTPFGRAFLWYGLGGLWLVDGLLQIQPPMSSSMFVDMVLAPVLQGLPSWYLRIMGQGIQLWTDHQIDSAVWAALIQLAIALLLLTGRDRWWGRLGLWTSIGWGAVVWFLGEGMGGILSGHPSFITGSPGSVGMYIVGAVLLLTPPAWWAQGKIERTAATWGGLFWLLCAVWQVNPGSGYWTSAGLWSGLFANSFATPQPAFIVVPIHFVAVLARQRPILWNGLFAAVMLGLVVMFWMRKGKRWTMALVLGWLFFTWWIGQDFGVVGGVGSDPNISPILAIVLAGAWGFTQPVGAYALWRRTARAISGIRERWMRVRRRAWKVYSSFAALSVLMIVSSFYVTPASATGDTVQKNIAAYTSARQSFSTHGLTKKLMTIFPSRKTVQFRLIATQTSLGGIGFDGFANGYMSVVVPVGWRVDVTFVNEQSLVINSAMIIPIRETQGGAYTAAFPGAFTPKPTVGVGAGVVQKFHFTADRAGAYAIVSAVPDGQTDSGLWDRFDVSATARIPYVAAK